MSSGKALHTLTAVEVHRLLRNNVITVGEYAHSLLKRIEERDAVIKAWAHFDPEFVIQQARSLDKVAKKDRGPLHGVAVGIKDIMNTRDMPTRYGSARYCDYRPSADSAAVAILRAAGALIIGKTTTSEFAVTNTGPHTTNPHDPRRTPGGSSAGSAAAVADVQVPLSIGVQSGGSVMRPASYTGIYAMKPSYNAISTAGQSVFSITYDTIGFFARSLEDLNLIANVFHIEDDQVPKSITLNEISVAIIKTPMWSQAGPGTMAAMGKATRILEENGARVEEVSLPAEINDAKVLERLPVAIMSGEARVAFLAEYQNRGAALPREICDIVENNDNITHKERLEAHDLLSRMRPLVDNIATRYSVILAPSAIDEAPPGIEDMGSPVFNTLWTRLHVPVINLPAFVGVHGMPVGISLIAARNHDRHLLRVGHMLAELLTTKN